MTGWCYTVIGEQVLCFHGPLIYEAKVCVQNTTCISHNFSIYANIKHSESVICIVESQAASVFIHFPLAHCDIFIFYVKHLWHWCTLIHRN